MRNLTPRRSAGAAHRARAPGPSNSSRCELFAAQGFEDTTIDQIAAAAGVSKRTFFRYFDSKSSVLWNDFDAEVDHIRRVLAADAGRPADHGRRPRSRCSRVNHYGAEDVPELRLRMSLVASVPELGAARRCTTTRGSEPSSTSWRGAPVGRRDSLYPLAVGRATLAACRAAYERWADQADADLTVYLDAALRALSAGFRDEVLVNGVGA